MREVPVPPDLPPLTGTAVASLAAILELDAAAVPAPADDHPDPWTVWRNWLAGRGLGMVPIARPADFNWPGPWLAVLRGDGARGLRRCVRLPARARLAPARRAGDVRGPRGGLRRRAGRRRAVVLHERRLDRTAGRVEAIAVAAAAEGPWS